MQIEVSSELLQNLINLRSRVEALFAHGTGIVEKDWAGRGTTITSPSEMLKRLEVSNSCFIDPTKAYKVLVSYEEFEEMVKGERALTQYLDEAEGV